MHRGLRRAVAAALVMAGGWLGAEEKKPERVAFAGLVTRGAEDDEKAEFGLGAEIAGRANGVVVETVVKGGPAEAAGIEVGDVVLAFDENRPYSDDELQDCVRSAKAGQKVRVLLKRREGKTEEAVELTLGSTDAPEGRRIAWRYAGPAQMQDALALAKQEGKLVMVGVSGAET